MSPSNDELVEALKRANRLIEWMAGYIGQMAPGDYAECYSDLNDHGIFMAGIEPKHWTDKIEGSFDGRDCTCGSGKAREEISDARGIFVAFVCDDCKRNKLSGYRPEIFGNPQYEADEPIEPVD